MIAQSFILLSFLVLSDAFLVPPTISSSSRGNDIALKSSNTYEPKVIDDILQDIHCSGYPFRIVVIGNGAILETTSPLGPIKKSSTSPRTGERITTLASEDQSFEFHVKVDQVKKIAFAETKKATDTGDKILRICRLLNEAGGSICSLILADASEESIIWFSELKNKYADVI